MGQTFHYTVKIDHVQNIYECNMVKPLPYNGGNYALPIVFCKNVAFIIVIEYLQMNLSDKHLNVSSNLTTLLTIWLFNFP